MPKMRSMMRRPSIRQMARATLTCLACVCVLLGAYSEYVGGLFSSRHWGMDLCVAAASGTLTLSLTDERRTLHTYLGFEASGIPINGLSAHIGDQRHWLPRASRPEYKRPVASKGADVVVVLPLWTFAALFGILSLCIRAAPVKAGVCHACGYSLTGLSARARCPECYARRREPTPERTFVSRIRLAGGRLCAAAAVVLVLAAACSEVRPTASIRDRGSTHVTHAMCTGCFYYIKRWYMLYQLNQYPTDYYGPYATLVADPSLPNASRLVPHWGRSSDRYWVVTNLTVPLWPIAAAFAGASALLLHRNRARHAGGG